MGKFPYELAAETGFIDVMNLLANANKEEIKVQSKKKSKNQSEDNEEYNSGNEKEIERKTGAKVADETKQLLEEVERLKIEKQQLEQQLLKASHALSSTPDWQNLPTYLNAETLEVSVDEYRMDPNEIGAGSFALVYKGTHVASTREVVIKKIKDAATNSKNISKFASEIGKIRFLVHPGIPKVEAFYRLNTDMCVVFRESNGRSVRNVMDENERLNKVPISALLPSDLLRLTVKLIEILVFVHSSGVVHYDIKPDNVLLCNSEYGVQLIDFGSAGLVSRTAQTANAFTPSYSPPEKLDSLAFDDVKRDGKSKFKLDVWSVGATILDACCSALLVTSDYDDNDGIQPYFSLKSLARGTITLFDYSKIPWDFDLVLSKYFDVCNEAKVVWEGIDNDIKDIIKVCLTHDISKRPFIHDITQMQSYQRLKLVCR